MPPRRSDALPAREISVRIAAPCAAVCRFLADPANWPRWAEGLGSLTRNADGSWTTHSPDGRVMRVAFSPPNADGIFDHTVYPPTEDGAPPIRVPLRAKPDGDGTMVTLTLIRQPEMDDATYERDAGWVRQDLARLKDVIEG